MPEAPNHTVLIIKNQKRSNRNVIVNVLFVMTSRIEETGKMSSCVFTRIAIKRLILYSQSYNKIVQHELNIVCS